MNRECSLRVRHAPHSLLGRPANIVWRTTYDPRSIKRCRGTQARHSKSICTKSKDNWCKCFPLPEKTSNLQMHFGFKWQPCPHDIRWTNSCSDKSLTERTKAKSWKLEGPSLSFGIEATRQYTSIDSVSDGKTDKERTKGRNKLDAIHRCCPMAKVWSDYSARRELRRDLAREAFK